MIRKGKFFKIWWMVAGLCFFLPMQLEANNCSSAIAMSLGSSSSTGLDASCDFGPASQYPCASCAGDAWFRWIPGSNNNNQFNVQFDISLNTTTTINVILLYSESKDLGDPCEWPSSAEGYSRYQFLCAQNMSPGVPIDITASGLDGSGTYFILVERVSGGSGTVTVTPSLLGNCPAPSNDHCSSPISLSSGNGIDPSVSTGPAIPNWMHALKGSTSCATKERLTTDCTTFGNGQSTEDHYKSNISFNCFYNGNVGDVAPFAPLGGQCDQYLENTVFYTFQVPVSANDYFIHFGSTGPCSQEPNNLAYMVFSSIDCNDAKNSNRIACNKTSVTGAVPTADWSFDNGGGGSTFIAGQTYWIVVDGTRGSQCDFCILIARGPDNPVLPVEFSAFEGYVEDFGNRIRWETSVEDGISSFMVERSNDGETFELLDYVPAEGNPQNGSSYTYMDHLPLTGASFYRINTVDINGVQSSSKTIQLVRRPAQNGLLHIYPQPALDELNLLLVSPEEATADISFYNLTGQILMERSTVVQRGHQEISLSVADLPTGIYLMRVRMGGRVYQKKILVQ